MSRIVVGVLGHVDHGKTALVRALTGIETDRLPEERRRGISIALGFAHFGNVDLIDMPGHERFVRTMVSGATGIDAVLLVVAANEGIKPQTVEHVDIAGLLGLRRAVVAVSKVDLAPALQAEAVAQKAVGLLRRAGLEVDKVVMTSTIDRSGVAELGSALLSLAGQDETPAEGVTFLPIDRVFSVAGHGTVVTGTLRGAGIGPGDVLELLPRGLPVRVRGVQVHGAAVAVAGPGQRVAVNLRDIEVGEIQRGDALSAKGALGPSLWLTLLLRAVDGAPTLRNGERLTALFGTTEVEARLRLLDRDELQPGECGLAQLHLAGPATLPAREYVILRRYSPMQTVAGGLVIEPEARRERRNDKLTLAWLAWLASASPTAIVGETVTRAGMAGTTQATLARLSGLSLARVAEVVARLEVVSVRGHVVAAGALESLLARVRQALQIGLTRERLLQALPGVGGAVLDEAVARLIAAGVVHEAGGLLSPVQPEADRARASAEAELAADLAERLRGGGLAPPDMADMAALTPAVNAKRAVDRLIREGVIIRAQDRAQKRFVLFHQDAIEEAQRRLQPLLARPPGLSVSEVGTALGISRKFSVPLLEHLDSIRFTRRVQDRRILAATREVC